ncbi:hypothetical protein D3C72_2512010 [compost metagenome]
MSGGVADDLYAVLVFGGNDLQLCILLNQFASIYQTTIDLTCHGVLGQSGADRSSHLHNCDRAFEFALRTIR